PEMEKAREETKDIAKNLGDILVYALYPQTGMRFLRWKYGLEEAPAEVQPRTMEDVKREDELIRQALKGELVAPPPPKETPERSARAKTYNVFVDGDYFSVEVDEQGELLIEPEPGRKAIASAAPPPQKKAVPVAPRPAEPKAKEPVKNAPETGVALKAPMPGIIVQVLCQVGSEVKTGDELIILEAMKMQNALTAASDGKIAEIRVKAGDSVGAGEVLIVIS
ncbi:MAG: biotin/lipoyl-containing protein, partial [Smithellaceae bacterium]|nr:biotin/lipoyl-containing protein [Smithellaceae bacterium]